MKKISEKLYVNDIILFELSTESSITLSSVRIYFLEKNSLYPNNAHSIIYNNSPLNKDLQTKVANLTSQNAIKCSLVTSELELINESKDVSCNYIWNSKNCVAGDYVIEWEWEENGEVLKKALNFTLLNDSSFPRPYRDFYDTLGKYEMLLDKYLPSHPSRYLLTAQDCTPQILNFLNKGIAQEFAFLENCLNELTEVYDSNLANDFHLQLLSTLFGRELRGTNSVLWKKQIKNSIKLLKKKGTLEGLKEALNEAGVYLKKITRLWQVVSDFYFTESFKITPETTTFKLSKNPLLKTSIFLKDGDKYEEANLSNFYFIESLEEPGTTLMVSRIPLTAKNIKITYNFREIPKENESIEKYIQELPLADRRDENEQEYPLKNWNIKLIEEDDPLFNIVIKERNPFYDPITYGKIRTTFLFSENIYNMDTYNGSLRNSNRPCDIDKDFLDNCSFCISNQFNLDLEIKNLSSERINEAKNIIKEFTPFAFMINNLNIYGYNKEHIMELRENINLNIEKDKKDKSDNKLKVRDIIYCLVEKEGEEAKLLEIKNEKE